MRNIQLRRHAWAVTLLSLLGAACDEPSPSPLDGPPEDAGRDEASVDAPDAQGRADANVFDSNLSSPPDGGPSGVEPSKPRDRCLEGTCADPVLPAQPDYTFLSDAGDGWLRLVQADWQLGAKSEGYRCVRKTIPEDVYIEAYRPINPSGTHHTTLQVDTGPAQADGVTVCKVLQGSGRRLQGSAVGGESTTLPEGVAMRLSKGEQIVMNLHLFNTQDQPLAGTSGMLIKVRAKADVQHEAQVMLSGPLGLTIPPGRVVQMGTCTLQKDATIFSLGPHMHQLGRHMKVTAHSALLGERVLHDQAFDFSHQLVYPIEQVQLAAGDTLRIECTYQNETTHTVGWGDSTLDEMCFVGVGLYPAAGMPGMCLN